MSLIIILPRQMPSSAGLKPSKSPTGNYSFSRPIQNVHTFFLYNNNLHGKPQQTLFKHYSPFKFKLNLNTINRKLFFTFGYNFVVGREFYFN